jgi:hypothetical protein
VESGSRRHKINLPPPATHTSNEPNAANSVSYGWFWTTHLCGWTAAGEVDVLILFFAHKNTDYKTFTHLSPFAPENAVAASWNYSKAGPRKRMAVHAVEALNSEEEAQKSWFCASVKAT